VQLNSNPDTDWTTMQIQAILNFISQIFNIQLLSIGEQQVSFGSILQFFAQGILVLLISRWIKQFLKRRILTRFGFDLGTRESLSTITSYVVTIVGFFIVLQSVGINLSSLTVFAGAVGFAFGFALQNLANNLISGVALLFEQPIKVGDYIEVESWGGTVEKIFLRSTIIVTPDGINIIVPNRYLLDKNIVNWTYRDLNSRIPIPISVLESTDSVLIVEALLAAARQEPRVLNSPSPQVFFKGFGDGVLNFDLMIWIDRPAEISPIKSALYFLIESEFRERSIKMTSSKQMRVTLENVEGLIGKLPIFSGINALQASADLVENPFDAANLIQEVEIKSANGLTLRDLLRKISYFEQCSDIELRQVIEKGYRKKLLTGTTICRENDPGDSFYIILSGEVEVFVESIGKQVAVRKPGEFIGEMSLLTGAPRTATLRTLANTTLFVVDRSNLQSLLARHQDLADKIAQELSLRQETLKSFGITIEESNKDESPVKQIRNRIKALFGV
jgi:potassium-dependent mechanosensitive channel